MKLKDAIKIENFDFEKAYERYVHFEKVECLGELNLTHEIYFCSGFMRGVKRGYELAQLELEEEKNESIQSKANT